MFSPLSNSLKLQHILRGLSTSQGEYSLIILSKTRENVLRDYNLCVISTEEMDINDCRAIKEYIRKQFNEYQPFNDKKKTVGRYDCINLLFLICVILTK